MHKSARQQTEVFHILSYAPTCARIINPVGICLHLNSVYISFLSDDSHVSTMRWVTPPLTWNSDAAVPKTGKSSPYKEAEVLLLIQPRYIRSLHPLVSSLLISRSCVSHSEFRLPSALIIVLTSATALSISAEILGSSSMSDRF